MMEFSGTIYLAICAFCLVSAILYIFVPFWIKGILNRETEIQKQQESTNVLLKEQNEILRELVEINEILKQMAIS